MPQKLLFIAVILGVFTTNEVHAQIREKGGTFDLINLERHQFTFNLLGPGLRYELGLFRNVSASTSFTPGLASYQEGYTFGYAWHTRLRYYHNFENRLDVNKNIVGNSADYVAVARSVFWGPLQFTDNLVDSNDFAIAFYGGVYGIQRTNRKGFNFNVELGAGYYRGDGVPNGYGPLLNFTFGWTPTKKKK
ncbi:hypothetical protein FK220_001570 [Flavobacteriaceae bacterium TP-CH-4]|uniref:DUF3575 domain-containing protein n=1 Tax=Pelagihabitans pacificus TaxID=2696054 RepID=A0A967AR70_9FLAO|nr:hypothetical protein [Pelagihabitans pacificus]NHF58010.1 hypothetical protein [Pelagihabitans pacificus]